MFVFSRYPSDIKAFTRSGMKGTWERERAGKRMKLKEPETWERLLSQEGNKASTWERLIGLFCVFIFCFQTSCLSFSNLNISFVKWQWSKDKQRHHNKNFHTSMYPSINPVLGETTPNLEGLVFSLVATHEAADQTIRQGSWSLTFDLKWSGTKYSEEPPYAQTWCLLWPIYG